MEHYYLGIFIICVITFLITWFLSEDLWLSLIFASVVLIAPIIGNFDGSLSKRMEFFINSDCGSNSFCRFVKAILILLLPVHLDSLGTARVSYVIMGGHSTRASGSILFYMVIGIIALLVLYLSGRINK